MNAPIAPIATVPWIPESAPFNPHQRAWLNGFLAGMLSHVPAPSPGMLIPVGAADANGTSTAAEWDAPWHDPGLPLNERLTLAEGRPLAQRMMAPLAQLDCGQCGYLCQSYAEALASGAESSSSLCVPGGKATQKVLVQILQERPANGARIASSNGVAAALPTAIGTRSNPIAARFIHAIRLNHQASEKDTRHVAIDLTDSPLDYEPGDSLGVFPENDSAEIERLLGALGLRRDVLTPEWSDLLRRQLDIVRPSDELLDLLLEHANRVDRRMLETLREDENADPHIIDLLRLVPSARPPLERLVGSMAKLQPRLYSIASSPNWVPGRVELLVGVVRYARNGTPRQGVASTYLAERANPENPISIFLHRSPTFRVPGDGLTPIIMIGPGTGLAPFRAFLQERAARGDRGKSWLFFGDQREAHDFLFRDELNEFKRRGVLTRLDTAFSRDQERKVYVQDRLREESADVWNWLEEGAHVYVCGDATRMARDVDGALRDVVRQWSGRAEDRVTEYMENLKKSGRYSRDVY